MVGEHYAQDTMLFFEAVKNKVGMDKEAAWRPSEQGAIDLSNFTRSNIASFLSTERRIIEKVRHFISDEWPSENEKVSRTG